MVLSRGYCPGGAVQGVVLSERGGGTVQGVLSRRCCPEELLSSGVLFRGVVLFRGWCYSGGGTIQGLVLSRVGGTVQGGAVQGGGAVHNRK